MANKAIPGPCKEIVEGITEHGGVFMVTYYFDDKYRPVPKEGADRAIVHEYDEKSRSVFRDYLFFNLDKDPEQMQRISDMSDEQYDELLAKQSPVRPPKPGFASSSRNAYAQGGKRFAPGATQPRSAQSQQSQKQGSPPAKKPAPPAKQSAQKPQNPNAQKPPKKQAAMPAQPGDAQKPQYKKPAPPSNRPSQSVKSAPRAAEEVVQPKTATAFVGIPPRPTRPAPQSPAKPKLS